MCVACTRRPSATDTNSYRQLYLCVFLFVKEEREKNKSSAATDLDNPSCIIFPRAVIITAVLLLLLLSLPSSTSDMEAGDPATLPPPSAPIPVAASSSLADKSAETRDFVQSSLYLRARSDSRSKTVDRSLTPLDQEQIEGLVSGRIHSCVAKKKAMVGYCR